MSGEKQPSSMPRMLAIRCHDCGARTSTRSWLKEYWVRVRTSDHQGRLKYFLCPRCTRARAAGFSVLELLLVMALIAVLTALTGPAVERAYRAAVARTAWVYHCTQARHHELDGIELPSGVPRFIEMTTDQAFERFYPQYRSFADVPTSTVKYWRKDPR